MARARHARGQLGSLAHPYAIADATGARLRNIPRNSAQTRSGDVRAASRYVANAFSFSLSLSEGMCFRLRMIDASVFTELAALSSFTMASSFGLSAAAAVCCTSIRA